MGLIFDILPYHVSGDLVSNTPGKIPIAPKLPSPQLFLQLWKLLEHLSCRYTFQHLHYLCRRAPWWHLNKYVDMIFHTFHCIYLELILLCNSPKHFFQVRPDLPTQYVFTVLQYPNQMVLDIKDNVLCPPNPHISFIHAKNIYRQTSLPRLMANRFPPASKLAGI